MIHIIVNPASGSGNPEKLLEQIRQELERRQLAFTVHPTQAPGHATQLTREALEDESCSLLLAVGGDGLLSEVSRAMDGSRIPLGIVPAGTGNDFIKTIGTPADPMEGLRFVLEHEAKATDCGKLNGTPFLNVCGTGFDVSVLEQTERFKKHLNGLLPYLLGLLCAIFTYKPRHVKLTIDGEQREMDALVCAIANGRIIGGGIPICPAASVEDGLLDLVLVKHVPRHRIFRYLPGLLKGKILSFDVTEHLLCRQVTIDCPGMSFNCDGEILHLDRATLEVCPGGIRIPRP